MRHQPEIGRRKYFEMLCGMQSKKKAGVRRSGGRRGEENDKI